MVVGRAWISESINRKTHWQGWQWWGTCTREGSAESHGVQQARSVSASLAVELCETLEGSTESIFWFGRSGDMGTLEMRGQEVWRLTE